MIKTFLDASTVSFVSGEDLYFGRYLCLGEMLTSIITVLWSAMTSTMPHFLIKSGLLVNTYIIENVFSVSLCVSGFFDMLC